jgi:hypothetical protein
MTKQDSGTHSEETFSRMQLQMSFPTFLKCLLQAFQMTFPVTENCKIVNEYFKEVSEKILEYIHHQPLESSGCVAQSERHPGEGKSPPFRRERGLQLITPPDEHLIVTGKSIEKAITLMSGHVIQDHVCERKREIVFLGGSVQFPEILTDPDLDFAIRSYLLRNYYDGGNPLGIVDQIDKSSLQ